MAARLVTAATAVALVAAAAGSAAAADIDVRPPRMHTTSGAAWPIADEWRPNATRYRQRLNEQKLHRLIDAKTIDGPVIDTPQALLLRREPEANVERYDGLRACSRGGRHAS